MPYDDAAPIWSSLPFVHTFADPFVEPQPRRFLTPAIDAGTAVIPADNKEKDGKDKEKPNLSCFPLAPTIEFVGKLLNNVHSLLPQAIEGIFDQDRDKLKKVTNTTH